MSTFWLNNSHFPLLHHLITSQSKFYEYNRLPFFLDFVDYLASSSSIATILYTSNFTDSFLQSRIDRFNHGSHSVSWTRFWLYWYLLVSRENFTIICCGSERRTYTEWRIRYLLWNDKTLISTKNLRTKQFIHFSRQSHSFYYFYIFFIFLQLLYFLKKHLFELSPADWYSW